MSYYTNSEMQAVTLAKMVKNEQICIVGTGLPLVGVSLAKRYYAPDCHVIVESGFMDCKPLEVPRSVGDLRFMEHCGVQWPNIRFIGLETVCWRNGDDRIVGFLGGAQIDPYGDVNSTSIGGYHLPKTRFSGSGGANGIASFNNTVLLMKHQKRRFMEKIDYITSPGWMGGPDGRKKAGLAPDRGPIAVVTDLGVMKFDEETKRMYLDAYYETSSPEMVIENTGFEIDVSRARKLDPPEPEVIEIIRKEVDPDQVFIKVPKE